MLCLVFAAGAALGSFLNVVALRSLSGESVSWPPSRCPACGARLGARDLVPVLSWIALRGRCRRCRARISLQYPLVEAGVGLLMAAVFARHGPGAEFWWLAALLSAMTVATVTDLREMTVPEIPVAAAGAAVVLLKLFWGGGTLLSELAAGAALFLAMRIAARFGLMGDGDPMLGALIGLALGPAGAAEALFWAVVAGGAFGAVLLVADRRNLRRRVPFAPFLALGCVAASLWPGAVAVLAGVR